MGIPIPHELKGTTKRYVAHVVVPVSQNQWVRGRGMLLEDALLTQKMIAGP